MPVASASIDADQAAPVFDFTVDPEARPGDVVGALAELLIDLARRRSLAERPSAATASTEGGD